MCKKVAFQVFQPSLTIPGSDPPILTHTLGPLGIFTMPVALVSPLDLRKNTPKPKPIQVTHAHRHPDCKIANRHLKLKAYPYVLQCRVVLARPADDVQVITRDRKWWYLVRSVP